MKKVRREGDEEGEREPRKKSASMAETQWMRGTNEGQDWAGIGEHEMEFEF